jgi:2-isopropylmalate synthase
VNVSLAIYCSCLPASSIAYIVKQSLSLDLPRRMQIAFYKVVQAISEATGRELSVADITDALRSEYHIGGAQFDGRIVLRSFTLSDSVTDGTSTPADSESGPDRQRTLTAKVSVDGIVRHISGTGNGPLSAFLNALNSGLGIDLTIREYSEHAIGGGSDVKAASYVEVIPPQADAKDKTQGGFWGIGVDPDITGSGLRAVLSAANGALGKGELKGTAFDNDEKKLNAAQ